MTHTPSALELFGSEAWNKFLYRMCCGSFWYEQKNCFSICFFYPVCTYASTFYSQNLFNKSWLQNLYHREMVHLAIDGMWQVFKLQQSTPRNDFCRIAAKNGILLRLINTLYSLNESTRLASRSFHISGAFMCEL